MLQHKEARMGTWRPQLTRRRFLTLAAGTTILGLGGYAWRIEPHWLEMVYRDLPIRNLPTALHGRTLAQVSDLHVGPVVDSEYLAPPCNNCPPCNRTSWCSPATS